MDGAGRPVPLSTAAFFLAAGVDGAGENADGTLVRKKMQVWFIAISIGAMCNFRYQE